jgi:O-antigen/teichoic acid export membrane protein
MAKSIKVNFLYNVVYQVLQIAIPLVTTPYLSRALGPVAVGTYSFTNAVVAYFVMACVLGMSTHGVRAIARSRHDSEMLAGEFWSAFTSQLLVGAVVLLAYLVYAFTLGGEYLYYYLMWSPILVGTVIDVSWFLFGLEDFGYTTARSLIIRVLGVVLIFAFVKGPEDLWCYVLITAGSKLLSSLSIWPRVLSRVSFVRPERASVKRHFLASLRLFVPVIAISLYNSLDKIMLGMISGTTEVGYYEYAGRMTSITSSVMGAMGTVVLPRVSSYVGEGREEEAIDLLALPCGSCWPWRSPSRSGLPPWRRRSCRCSAGSSSWHVFRSWRCWPRPCRSFRSATCSGDSGSCQTTRMGCTRGRSLSAQPWTSC